MLEFSFANTFNLWLHYGDLEDVSDLLEIGLLIWSNINSRRAMFSRSFFFIYFTFNLSIGVSSFTVEDRQMITSGYLRGSTGFYCYPKNVDFWYSYNFLGDGASPWCLISSTLFHATSFPFILIEDWFEIIYLFYGEDLIFWSDSLSDL